MSKEADESSSVSTAGWVESTRQYFTDVRNELPKITWPKRQEAIGGTIGVLVVVGVITLVLSLVDVSLSKLVEWILP